MNKSDDLISRQDIKYHTQLEAMGNGQYEEVEVAYKNDIESLPSADRSTGEWIMHIDDLYPEESTQECSNCHKHETIFIRHDSYCPNCGTRMTPYKGGENE